LALPEENSRKNPTSARLDEDLTGRLGTDYSAGQGIGSFGWRIE
jgi:hypothetical protein